MKKTSASRKIDVLEKVRIVARIIKNTVINLMLFGFKFFLKGNKNSREIKKNALATFGCGNVP